VTDRRSGEDAKGVATLGALRDGQDSLIAEGLLVPYTKGDEPAPELREWAIGRIRQLAAHEVGHTLGLGHNYYDSDAGRISVMDYPHPLVTLKPDGSLDYSKVYATGIGEWDKVAVKYGYSDFAAGTDERATLQGILDEAWKADLRYMTNQDTSANPRVDQWSNGTDPAAELVRMLGVRRASMERFGEQAIKRGQPMALIEEVLVPLYLHHRYQVEAAASAVGGLHYIYAMRGDNREPVKPVPAREQRAALDALMASIKPSELALPSAVLTKIPPRPSGYGMHRELFPRTTGSAFDPITPAAVAADLVIGQLLDAPRAARLVTQRALDPTLPGLETVIDRLRDATSRKQARTPYEREISRAMEHVLVENLISLAGSASMPQVRAIATYKLKALMSDFNNRGVTIDAPDAEVQSASARYLSDEIKRYLERPAQPAQRMSVPDAPPGAPIGQPAMEWLRRVFGECGY
jgi:hypothetical protein